MFRKFVLNIFVFNLIWSLTAAAQTSDRILFENGVNSYQAENFKAAEDIFLKILKEYPRSDILTSVKLMLGKTYYLQKNYRSALIVCDNFLNTHQKSDYVDDIHFLKGKIYYKQNNFTAAVEEWLKIIYQPGDPRLKRTAGWYVFNTAADHLSENDFVEIQKQYDPEPLTGILTMVRAQKLFRTGNREEGQKQLQNFLRSNPFHQYYGIAREILTSHTNENVISNKILILKSDLEGLRDISTSITEGFSYAVHEMSSRFPEKVVSVDSFSASGEILTAIQNFNSFLISEQPLAVVSATSNDVNATFTLFSKYENIPLIAPLSPQDGLTNIGPGIFQINPDAEIKGRFLGEFATRELGGKTFAILAPADAYGENISNSFEDAVIRNEGEIVEKQWFYEDTEDFSRQLKAIRNKGFYIAFRDSVREADSTLSDLQIEELFSEYKNEVLFSTENVRGSIDSTQVPSTGIDGVFIAIYPWMIPYVAPQFANRNIQTTILGNEGWNDPEQLRNHQIYLDGLIYISSGFIDQESWNFREFRNRFRQKLGTTPGNFHLLGYDIGKWMISAFQPGMTRSAFREALQNSGKYEGIFTNIQFGTKPRVNTELNVIRFYLGQFLKLK